MYFCISIEECGIVLPMRQNVRGLKVAIRKYSLKMLMQLIPFEGLYNYMRLYKLGMRGGDDVLLDNFSISFLLLCGSCQDENEEVLRSIIFVQMWDKVANGTSVGWNSNSSIVNP